MRVSTDTSPYTKARVLFWTDRLTEAEDVLRHGLEENPTRFESLALLVEVVLAKGDREDAVRISNRVAELDTPALTRKASAGGMIRSHLGDNAGAVELMRSRLSSLYLSGLLHSVVGVPQSLADYAPFQELVGWPPPAPN